MNRGLDALALHHIASRREYGVTGVMEPKTALRCSVLWTALNQQTRGLGRHSGPGAGRPTLLQRLVINIQKPGVTITIRMANDEKSLLQYGHRVLDALYVSASLRQPLSIRSQN